MMELQIENGVLLKYDGTAKKVSIPIGVTSIGSDAFRNSEVKFISLPDGVISIGDSAFRGSELTDVTLPEGLKSIGDYAFASCKKLPHVIIPESVTHIGEHAFENSGLQYVSIPGGILRISSHAFCRCKGLTGITIQPGVSAIGGYAFSKCPSLREVTIPGSVKRIGNCAFSDCGVLSGVTLAEGVVHIGNRSFWGRNNGLKEVLIPYSVEHIGERAFPENCSVRRGETESTARCSALGMEEHEDEAVGRDNPQQGKQTRSTEKRPARSERKNNGNSNTVPKRTAERNTTNGIAGMVFTVDGQLNKQEYGWDSLSALRKYLENYGAELSSSVTKKTDYLVCCKTDNTSEKRKKAESYGIPAITEADFNEMVGWCFKDTRHIVIPGWIKCVENRLFRNCPSLMSVEVADGVTEIGISAFSGCERLKSVTIPDSVKQIGDGAFAGCHSLTDVTIPDGVEKIGSGIFKECPNPQIHASDELIRQIHSDYYTIEGGVLLHYRGPGGHVIIPDGVRVIGDDAFKDYHGLTSITIPDGVKEIGWGAFCGCEQLQSVFLPDSLREINYMAFSHCSGLKDIAVPPHVRIGAWNFINCKGLADREGFVIVNGDLYYYVGQGGDIAIPESVRHIAYDGAFLDSNLSSIIVPKQVYAAPDFFPESVYVGVFDRQLVSKLPHPIYLGGPLDDIAPHGRDKASFGFLYAMDHGIHGVEAYRESYVRHIAGKPALYLKLLSSEDVSPALVGILMEEKLLNEKQTKQLIQKNLDSNRPELMAALLEYQNREFRSVMPEDMALGSIPNEPAAAGIAGIAFVVTGELKHFKGRADQFGAIDRSDLKQFIEKRGGFLRGSISSKTNYLICNDLSTGTTKIQKARELGVPVINEEEFLQMAGEIEA